MRRNSTGLDLSDENALRMIDAAFSRFGAQQWHAAPLVNGTPKTRQAQAQAIVNPADRRDTVGQVSAADAADVDAALSMADAYAMDWQTLPPANRAELLTRAADLLEQHRLELMAIAIREAGKTLPNALAEVREAVDFLRYYAAQVHGTPNALALGPVACISPWNFPLSIFIGQVSAALAAGNVVLAKPAEQTPLIAHRAVQLLHEAGIPHAALQFLPGRGETVGARLVADRRVRGVVFTGSTEVANIIHRALAQRAVAESCDIPLIAETGGQNAMIVDSSALPEQVVQDVITSAFDSAGQRCSALRVLCVQEDIAEDILRMLKHAMQELRVANPDRLATDIGPVIDADAQCSLTAHIDRLKPQAKDFYQLPLDAAARHGSFVAPTLLEISAPAQLQREVFGPVLHVLRYAREQLPQLVDAINATGYGLTLGIHSRIDETVDLIVSRAHVGNIYVNRNIVGAVVGVQPFGGEGRSGTGPKAGGPLYIKRLQRNPAIALPVQPQPHKADMHVLGALLAWTHARGHARIAELGEQYSRATLLGATLPLHGPTGERNSLSFAPRGKVLCAAASLDALLNQLAAVFATGNGACMANASRGLLPADLPPAVRDAIVFIERPESSDMPLAAALVEASQAPLLREPLAARESAVTPLIETVAEAAIPLWRLVAERALCVNTAAAGGNASLMMLD